MTFFQSTISEVKILFNNIQSQTTGHRFFISFDHSYVGFTYIIWKSFRNSTQIHMFTYYISIRKSSLEICGEY